MASTDPKPVSLDLESAETLADAIARATVKATQEARADERPIEVRNPPKKSVFNPTGGIRPHLKCQTVFCGAEQQEDNLTNQEIGLFNQLHAGRYQRGRWQVIVREDGIDDSIAHMDVRIPSTTLDERIALPSSLVEILRVMIAEHGERQHARATAAA